MRFGRVLGPDALAVSDQYRGHVPHLRKVSIDNRDVYLDLNVSGIQAYSDADFPDWQGWTFIDDDTDGNSRCDSKKLVDLILAQLPPAEPEAARRDAQAAPAAEPPTPAQQQRDRLWRAYKHCDESAVRDRLKRCVVKMPTEWARDDFDTRWGWVKNAPGDAPSNVLLEACLSPEAYEKFKRHHSALAFWEDARAAGLTVDKVHYHFHPKLFVETWKKCGWLSVNELAQCIPRQVIDETKDAEGRRVLPRASILWDKAYARAARFALPLNKALRRYAISTTSLRMAYFLANSIQETMYLTRTSELGGEVTRYAPWYGRGLLQLTWEENYVRYGKFRGLGADATAFRDSIESNLTNACDSAGFYWITSAKDPSHARNINREADNAPLFRTVTLENLCDNYDYGNRTCRSALTTMESTSSNQLERVARAVNTGNPDSTGQVNGLIARENVFHTATYVLTNLTTIDHKPSAQRE
jgi:hydroxyethylthiazole kinase